MTKPFLRLFGDGRIQTRDGKGVAATFRLGQCWTKQTRTAEYEVCDALITYIDDAHHRCHVKVRDLDAGARCVPQRVGFGSLASFGLIEPAVSSS